MHCSRCGHVMSAESRFCSACGAAVAQPVEFRWQRRILLRPRYGRMVAGVCAAFGQAYGWDVTLLRILLVVLTPFHLGLGFLAYLIAWIVIPEEPILLPSGAPQPPPAASV